MKKTTTLLQSQRMQQTLIQLTGILVAMILAGLIGRYAAEAATRSMGDELTKLVIGIVIGAGIGLVVGILVRRVWGKLVGATS